jgi:hypothetical protein
MASIASTNITDRIVHWQSVMLSTRMVGRSIVVTLWNVSTPMV